MDIILAFFLTIACLGVFRWAYLIFKKQELDEFDVFLLSIFLFVIGVGYVSDAVVKIVKFIG